MLLIPFKFLVEILSTQIHLDRFFFFIFFFFFICILSSTIILGAYIVKVILRLFFFISSFGKTRLHGLFFLFSFFLIYKMKQQNLEKPI